MTHYRLKAQQENCVNDFTKFMKLLYTGRWFRLQSTSLLAFPEKDNNTKQFIHLFDLTQIWDSISEESKHNQAFSSSSFNFFFLGALSNEL